jgi:Ion transport protein
MAMLDKVSDFWLQLLNECPPKVNPSAMSYIVDLNQGEMSRVVDRLKSSLSLLSIELLEKFMSKEKYWSRHTGDHMRRIEVMRIMMEYRTRNHIEMLDLSKFRQIVDIKKLSCLFAKSYFINMTVQENTHNSLLTLQGYFLKNFIYFHMRHDMRFKASIDSFMIEMDNPKTRQAIRLANRNDEFIKNKYLSTTGFNVEVFCEHLLNNFFPKIAGIWADHSQMAPAYILQFIRICLEYGMISSSKARLFLDGLVKATDSLMKLEEGWVEKPSENKKFSVKIKLYNVTGIFAKCREHMSMIIINIIMLINDEFFMQKFPEYVKGDTKKADIIEESKENFLLFNKSANDAVLFITMNYLSNPVEIMDFKSTNIFCNTCIEKIFFMITSRQNDCYLNSLKQINGRDLKYIEVSGKDVISSDLKDLSLKVDQTLRALLNTLSMGIFEQTEGTLITSAPTDKAFEQYLKKYVTTDQVNSIETIITKISKEIRSTIMIEEDYKVALVRESVPLKLVALAHYCWEYLDAKAYSAVAKEIFDILGDISASNNFAKSQLFKGECLFHLSKLLSKFDIDAFMLLFKICNEDNASVFLGKEMFNIFLNLYEKFNGEICKNLDLENPAKGLNVENCGTLLLMTKYMHKLFSRLFLNETDKLQNMLLTQEAMFKSMSSLYLPLLISQTAKQAKVTDSRPDQGLHNLLFEDGKEMQLMKEIKADTSNDDTSKLILVNHLAYWSLKLYNRLSKFSYSEKQYEVMHPFCDRLVDLIKDLPDLAANDWSLPIAFEAEILAFLCNMRILPQQNIMIESSMTTIEHVFGSSYMLDRHVADDSQKAQRAAAAKGKEAADLQHRHNKANVKEFNKKELDLLDLLMSRVNVYSESPERAKEGLVFLYDGLFPLLYKYILSIFKLNLTTNSRDSRMLYESIDHILNKLSSVLPMMNKLTGKNLSLDLHSLGFEAHVKDAAGKDTAAINVSLLPRSSAGGTRGGGQVDSQKQETISLAACRTLLDTIDGYYEGVDGFVSPAHLMRDMSKDEYEESISNAKFDQSVKRTGEEALKQKKLKKMIKAYQNAKTDYLERSEEPNLIGFFDRNNQNLRGVFNSCLDRLLNRKKLERHNNKETLSSNNALSKFWTNRSVRGYVRMMVTLVSKSTTGRHELFEFINEHESKNADDEHDEGDAHSAREYITMRDNEEQSGNSQNKVYREDLLACLIRIHVDLVFYLNSNSSRHSIWWVTHQTYEMISMFFKNLCECNFIKFKVYLGTKQPYIKDHNWQLHCHEKSYSDVFSTELTSVMKTTRIGVNRDPVMIRTDFHERVQEILKPMLEIINEATIGPCVENQGIFLKTDTASLCNVATRLVDDMSSEFYGLAMMTLSVVIALMEGSDSSGDQKDGEHQNTLEKLASRLPATILADRLLRLTKKLYVQQLIETGDYESACKDKRSKLESTGSSVNSSPIVVPKIADYELAAKSPSTEKPNLAKNVVMPTSSKKAIEDAGILDDITEKLACIITEEIENSVEINHWKDLLDMYMDNMSFSGSPTFEFCFKLIVLWKNLASISKSHANRLQEINYESDLYFKKKSLFTISRKKKESVGENKQSSELTCIYYFFTKKVMCEIEILDPEQKSVAIYFPRLPATFMLAGEAKRNYRDNCDISDSNTKMIDLLRNFDLFEIKMDSSYNLSKKLGSLYKLVSTDAFLYYTVFCWWLGFALNIALCLGMTDKYRTDNYTPQSTQYKTAILVLALILISLSALLLILWVASKFVQTYQTCKEDYKFDHLGQSADTLKAKIYIAVQKSFFEQPFPMSYSMHIIFTVLGLTYSPFFYTLNMLLIINISKTTKFVLAAILLHIDQLALTFMLAIFIIFLYTLLVMGNFYDQINLEKSNPVCNQLYTCFFYVFNYGLRNGGGFAESMTPIDTENQFAARTLFDISFYILITVIFLNIIFGIIIDTFSQLRDEQYERGIYLFIHSV